VTKCPFCIISVTIGGKIIKWEADSMDDLERAFYDFLEGLVREKGEYRKLDDEVRRKLDYCILKIYGNIKRGFMEGGEK
jgi:hypothetical protein